MTARPDAGRATRHLAGWIPTLAVVIGLHRLQSAWIAMGLYHALALLYLALEGGGDPWRALLRGWHRLFGPALALLGAASGLALLLLFPRAALDGPSFGLRLAEAGVTGDLWWLFCAWYLAITPWLEEWLWRGKLGSASVLPDRSDLMFAAYHVLVLVKFLALPWAAFSFLVLVGAGWAWRQVRRRTGGLLVPLVSHLVADVGVIVAASLLLGR